MKAVILAGGFGTRLSEETDIKPKPMLDIGGRPILWHIMKNYSEYGITDFVILCGYKGYYIKEYFANYFLHQCDVTISTATNKLEIHNNQSEDWRITLVDTGNNTMTGGRILRAKERIGNEPFLLTYGDGVSDVPINKLIEFHKNHKKKITMTAVRPEGRFGALEIGEKGLVTNFIEKPVGDGNWINGGFFVCEPEVFDYIKDGDQTIWERGPLETAVAEKELLTYQHAGFWKCMDTLRDKQTLNQIWESGEAPWKIWN